MSTSTTMHSRIKLSMGKSVWRESRGRAASGRATQADGPTPASGDRRSQLPVLNSIKMAEEPKAGEDRAQFMEEENREPPAKQEFEGPNCRAETVVVYLDRAEVCRSLKTRIRKGESELLLKNVSPCIEKDSVRVEAKGSITITDVSLQTRHLAADEQESRQAYGSINQIRNDLLRQNKFKSKLLAKQQRLRKQREVLDLYLDSLMKPGCDNGKDEKGSCNHESLKSKLEASSSVLEGINSFFEMYNRQASRLDDSIDKNQVEIDDVQSKIEKNERSLAQMNAEEEEKEAKELVIIVDAPEAVDVELYITYVVIKAGWSPKYDIRVFSNDGTMKIVYYGIVTQGTGESWDDTKLCLSTAMPSIGGTVPELGTHTLAFKYKLEAETTNRRRILARRLWKTGRSKSFHHGSETRSLLGREDLMERNLMDPSSRSPDEHSISVVDDNWPDLMETPAASPQREVKESITSTMYEIARRTSIPCDNEGHKVSVAIVDLKPTFEYECVPRKSAHAYLKAKVRNTSPYALLAGPTNIFLDNNFVAKSELKPVSPSEDFTCSLGVDPGVRVSYRPLHKYREQAGLLSKAALTTYKQVIELKNTHNEPIHILVTDQLPMSMEEKIKVTLQEPVIKHPEKHDMSKPTRLNKHNNVEWELEISANEIKELTLKYSIEHPMGEDLESMVMQMSNSSIC